MTIDARVGGRCTYTMVSDETDEKFRTGGLHREVVPFEQLVFTWDNPDDDPAEAPVVTITPREPADDLRIHFASVTVVSASFETCVLYMLGYPGMVTRTIGRHLATLLDGVLVDDALIDRPSWRPPAGEVMHVDTTSTPAADDAARVYQALRDRGFTAGAG